MSISLRKGENTPLSLSKGNPLNAITVGCGWKAASTTPAYDLDVTVFAVGGDDRVASSADFVFFHQKEGADGSIVHCGDNRDGEGEGDDETVMIALDKVPARIEKIVFCVSIYDAKTRGQNFGVVGDAYVRVINPEDGTEVVRYDLAEDFGAALSVVLGEVYRKNGEWKFRALGQGLPDEAGRLCEIYGVQVGE